MCSMRRGGWWWRGGVVARLPEANLHRLASGQHDHEACPVAITKKSTRPITGHHGPSRAGTGRAGPSRAITGREPGGEKNKSQRWPSRFVGLFLMQTS